jgi:hypothetical protein
MTSYSKPLFSGLCVMLMISLLPVHTAADRMFLQSDEGEIMVDPDGDYLFYPDVLSDFSGFTSSGGDPSFCFDATPRSSFTQGSSVKFNVFWNDTVEEDGLNEYLVAMAIKLGVIRLEIFARDTVRFPFPATPPGSAQTFCFSVPVTLNQDAPIGTFPWGSRVTKLADGTRLQGFLNSLTITEGPKQ